MTLPSDAPTPGSRTRPDESGRVRRAVARIADLPGISAVVALFSAARYVVEGESMEPALSQGQYVLVNRRAYLRRPPQRGDVVALHDPRQPETQYIKRVVGLPGEYVRVQRGATLINDDPLLEPYARHKADAPDLNPQEWLLDDDEYVVLGDNRANSRDSRRFGPVPRHLLVGRVWLRYWPPGAWGRMS